jgi:NADPH2:quinone reductase
MKAAWYEMNGPSREVLVIGTMPDPVPGPGEVRIRVAASGINPGDVKKRQDAFGYGMPFPRVIPHSDGAGTIDAVGEQVARARVGERVWCYGAQSYRAFGTAAEYVVVPSGQAIPLPQGVSFEQGACLGIPGITAHRAVHAAGPVAGRTVLVQGGAGAVGVCAVGLARLAGARVLATVRSDAEAGLAGAAGAQEVVRYGERSRDELIQDLRALVPAGMDHVVEVAFGANIEADCEVLANGGSIAAYATGTATPAIPFWPLVFKNIRIFFLGSDDFPQAAKAAAAESINAMLVGGWPGFRIDKRVSLSNIAEAHEYLEQRHGNGRAVVITASSE